MLNRSPVLLQVIIAVAMSAFVIAAAAWDIATTGRMSSLPFVLAIAIAIALATLAWKARTRQKLGGEGRSCKKG